LAVNPTIQILGCDISSKSTLISSQKGNNVILCNNLNLPYGSSLFDAIMSIEVIHHLSSESRRLMALQEIFRCLKPGGLALIYVWAMEQQKRKFGHQDVLVKTEIDVENNKTDTIQRYFHVFRYGELESLLSLIENIEVLDRYFDHNNWCVVVKKLK